MPETLEKFLILLVGQTPQSAEERGSSPRLIPVP